IGGSVGRRAEVDIERDLADAGLAELVDQIRMQLPRPRPHADLADRIRIDRDEDDIAAGLARERAKPQVGQRVLQNAPQSGQERKHDHACDKYMWSISLHALGPPVLFDALLECRRSGSRRLMTATRPVPLAIGPT